MSAVRKLFNRFYPDHHVYIIPPVALSHERNEFFSKEFFRTAEGRIREQSSLDKLLLVLSTGSFALSLSFILGIEYDPKASWLLMISWVFLFLALLSQLIGYRVAVKHLTEAEKSISQAITENASRAKLNIKFQKLIGHLNDASAITAILGLITLFIFSGINLYK